MTLISPSLWKPANIIILEEEYEFLEEAFDIFYWGHYEKNKTHCTFEKLSEIYCMGYPYDMSEKPIKTKQKRLKISIIKKIEKLYQRNTRKNKKLSKVISSLWNCALYSS